jgi:hypothetical protein
MPKNILEIFCLTQVFEKRTLDHFTKHLNMPGTHPLVRQALQKMIDDESGHLGWIREELDNYSQTHGPGVVEKTMKHLEEIDKKVYERLSKTESFKTYFKELA